MKNERVRKRKLGIFDGLCLLQFGFYVLELLTPGTVGFLGGALAHDLQTDRLIQLEFQNGFCRHTHFLTLEKDLDSGSPGSTG